MSGYFDDHVRPHARLAILRFLEDAPRYTSNVSILVTLLPQVGVSLSRDQVRTEVDWLAAQGLVTAREAASDFIIVEATVAGVEVAQGVTTHHGVTRRRPGS